MLKRYIRLYPAFYFGLFGWRRRVKKLRAYKDSDLVLEGFPRSANTVAVLTLQYSNKNLKMGHHLHVPAHIKYAARHCIPCLIVIRNPIDSVVSLMVMEGGGDPKRLFKHFIDFANTILSLREHIILIPFEKVVKGRLGDGVAALNKKFGTDFKLPETSLEQRDWVEDKVRKLNLVFSSGNLEKISMPNKVKESKAAPIRKRLENEALLESKTAYKLYSELMETSDL